MNHLHLLLACAMLTASFATAQTQSADSLIRTEDYPNRTEDSLVQGDKTLFEEVTDIRKKTDKFNLYLNMQADFNALWQGNTFDEGKFRMKQLRIEATGRLNKWLSYRYRQRLNKGDSPDGYRDNALGSIDYAAIGLTLGKWEIFMGKQCAAYGGIDFNLNPIEVLENSAITDYMSNFMTGVKVTYNITPRQAVQFQVLNSLTESSKKMYGDWEKSKMPLLYTINWSANFNDFYKTKWSVSLMNETKGRNLFLVRLGNQFDFTDRFGMFVDWAYTRQAVDRMGLVTKMVNPEGTNYNTAKVDYMSAILHLHYRFLPRWNVFVKGICDTSGIYRSHDGLAKGNYRTSWGYLGGVEYYPFKDYTIHFFAAYIGRTFDYSHRAEAFGNKDYSTNSLAIGFIWQMPVF